MHALAIEHARQNGPFRTLDDFARRTRLPRGLLVRLAEADAFGSIHRGRRDALWEAIRLRSDHLPLFADLEDDEPAAPLPPLSPLEEVFADYRAAGLSLRAHPLSFYREALETLGVAPLASLKKLRHGRRARVAGLVLLRQRPSTAKGITFVTLEDETGVGNLVVHYPTWERHRRVARGSAAWIASGHVERKDEVIHLVVQRLEDLSAQLLGLQTKSRDFR